MSLRVDSWKEIDISASLLGLLCTSQHCRRALNIDMQTHHFVTFFPWLNSASGSGPPHYRGLTITLRHTTLNRTPLDQGAARRTDLYLTTHNIRTRQISMPTAGIRTGKPIKRAATGFGIVLWYYSLPPRLRTLKPRTQS
jgi:hypothetical protein